MKIKKVYLGQQQIRPDSAFNPGIDTLAYYPFKGDMINKVNGISGTLASGSTIGDDYATTDGLYIQCPMSEYIDVTSHAFTASIYLQPYQRPSYNPRVYDDASMFYMVIQHYNSTYARKVSLGTATGTESYCGAISDIGNWSNIIVSYPGSGTTTYVYINGVKYTYETKPSGQNTNIIYLGRNRGGSSPSTDNAYFYFSEFIVEKKQWTDQEVSTYFNKTKSLYGIS